jgi:hypothetical protein
MGDGKRRRRRVEPTDDWEQLRLLCLCPDCRRRVQTPQSSAVHEASRCGPQGRAPADASPRDRHRLLREVRQAPGLPMPLRMVRCFPHYHEIEEPRDHRMAVVRLHAGG